MNKLFYLIILTYVNVLCPSTKKPLIKENIARLPEVKKLYQTFEVLTKRFNKKVEELMKAENLQDLTRAVAIDESSLQIAQKNQLVERTRKLLPIQKILRIYPDFEQEFELDKQAVLNAGVDPKVLNSFIDKNITSLFNSLTKVEKQYVDKEIYRLELARFII